MIEMNWGKVMKTKSFSSLRIVGAQTVVSEKEKGHQWG